MPVKTSDAAFLDVRSFDPAQPPSVLEALEAAPVAGSPFLSLYEMEEGATPVNHEAEEYAAFLNEMYDPEFNEALFELAGEAVELHDHRSSFGAEATSGERLMQEHFAPLANEAEAMLEAVGTHSSTPSTRARPAPRKRRSRSSRKNWKPTQGCAKN